MTAVTSDAVFHAFASFMFLSNISVMFTKYQVVNFVTVWNSAGYFQKQVLYTDPTVEWNTSVPYVIGTFSIALLLSAISFFPRRFFISDTLRIAEMLWMILVCIVS